MKLEGDAAALALLGAGLVFLASEPVRGQAGSAVKRVVVLEERGGRVSWSHARDLIAFDRPGADGRYDVFTIRPDGSDLWPLTEGAKGIPRGNNGQPAWHPSGEYLAFQAEDPALDLGPQGGRGAGRREALEKQLTGPGIGIHNNLWIAAADGSRFWPLTRVGRRGGVLHPHFSPDGRKLVWSQLTGERFDRIGHWTIQLAEFSIEGRESRLSNVRTLRPRDLQLYETHGFSPDGRRILFSGIERGKGYFDMEIYAMDVGSGEAKRLTSNDEWDEHAHFTPDGGHIVWASSRGIPQPRQTATLRLDYWVMGADGSGQRRLTRLNDPAAPEHQGRVVAADFDFGPDGTRVVAYLIRGRSEGVTVLIELDREAAFPTR